jgi:hypothetical protein
MKPCSKFCILPISSWQVRSYPFSWSCAMCSALIILVVDFSLSLERSRLRHSILPFYLLSRPNPRQTRMTHVVSDPEPHYLLNPTHFCFKLKSKSCHFDLLCCIVVVHQSCLNHAFHYDLGLVWCQARRIEPSSWWSTFMKLKKTNCLLFLSKDKHWCIPTPIGFSLYNYL